MYGRDSILALPFRGGVFPFRCGILLFEDSSHDTLPGMPLLIPDIAPHIHCTLAGSSYLRVNLGVDPVAPVITLDPNHSIVPRGPLCEFHLFWPSLFISPRRHFFFKLLDCNTEHGRLSPHLSQSRSALRLNRTVSVQRSSHPFSSNHTRDACYTSQSRADYDSLRLRPGWKIGFLGEGPLSTPSHPYA